MNGVPRKDSWSKSGHCHYSLKRPFFKDSTTSSIVLCNWKISISYVLKLGTIVFWYRKTSFSVLTWHCKGSVFVIMTNHSIEWISILICISDSLILMLILTLCYFAIWIIASPSRSIVWNCPPWLTKGKFPPSHCNTLFICFFMFLTNTIVIFHKQKWSIRCIYNLNYFFDFFFCNNYETLEIIIHAFPMKINNLY
jgi:hypothetical protein